MMHFLTGIIKTILTLQERKSVPSFRSVDVASVFSQLIARFEIDRIICVKMPMHARFSYRVFKKLQADHLPCEIITWRELLKRNSPRGDGCVYFIGDANAQQCAYFQKNRLRCITLYDLLALDQNREFLSADIPLVINTLENSFRSIAVYGKSNYARGIRRYLAQNPNLCVTKADTESLSDSELTLVIDLLPAESLDAGYAIYWKDLFYREITDAEGDVIRNIVPYLTSKGVSVLYVTTPNRFAFQKPLRTFLHMWRFWQLTLKNQNASDQRLLQSFHTEELLSEYLNLHARTDIGYPRLTATGKYYNYRNGLRYTPGNDENADRALYLFGPCIVSGGYVSDSATIGSFLQKTTRGFCIRNRGTCTDRGMNLNMRSIVYKAGDIAVVFTDKYKLAQMDEANIPRYDLTASYQKIEDLSKHIGDGPYHCDSTVNQLIANDLHDCLAENGFLESPRMEIGAPVCFGSAVKRIPRFHIERYAALYTWLDGFAALRKDGRNGGIVMNCNPFTLGHEYLIRTAAAAVDFLYVFIVEENQSFFSFADRLQLVREGTKSIPNVIVLPSGRHMISSDTLPGYFSKDTATDAYVDATEDLELFLQIADYFGIQTRFVGKEPYDAFTRQYNENMKSLLPMYGMDVVEIERMKNKDFYISASMVRKYIESGEPDAVKAMVPESTFDYIRKRFFENKGGYSNG